eukprot:m51a1_g1844 hypothetical protein (108) ;mRNA; f:577773-578175
MVVADEIAAAERRWRGVPKSELHVHIGGCVRQTTLRSLAGDPALSYGAYRGPWADAALGLAPGALAAAGTDSERGAESRLTLLETFGVFVRTGESSSCCQGAVCCPR